MPLSVITQPGAQGIVRMKAIVVAAVIASTLWCSRCEATVVYNSNKEGTGTDASGSVYLTRFDVVTAGTVTAMGAYDDNRNGFGAATVQVALYKLSGSTWSQVAGTLKSFSGTTT